jgi:hypothetical protein
MKLDKEKTALSLGIFFGLVHLVWAVLVLLIPGSLQTFLNWIYGVHFLNNPFFVTGFNLVSAVFLVLVTFASGYVFGWVFAEVWNWAQKRK